MMIDLAGKRILVVEDEYFIAKDIRHTLSDAGADVIGPVGNLAGGLRLAEDEQLDAAILDVNLGHDRSFAIVDHLAAHATPHLFLTGYDDWSLPEEHRDAPRLAKPFKTSGLLAAVAALIATPQVPS